MGRRFVALLLSFTILSVILLSFHASAVDYTTNNNFWQWVVKHPLTNTMTLGIVGHLPASGACPDSHSTDGKHHASSVTGFSDDGHYICVCEYCGQEFTSSTLAADDAETAYNDYVETLRIVGVSGLRGH